MGRPFASLWESHNARACVALARSSPRASGRSRPPRFRRRAAVRPRTRTVPRLLVRRAHCCARDADALRPPAASNSGQNVLIDDLLALLCYALEMSTLSANAQYVTTRDRPAAARGASRLGCALRPRRSTLNKSPHGSAFSHLARIELKPVLVRQVTYSQVRLMEVSARWVLRVPLSGAP
jgi:hypothetical protein